MMQRTFELRDPRYGVLNFTVEKVSVVFFNGGKIVSRSAYKTWFNRLVHYARGIYTHCEFAFRLSVLRNRHSVSHLYLECSLHAGEPVRIQVKEYENTLWHWFGLKLTAAQRDALFEQCTRDVHREPQITHSGWWMYWNFACPFRALRRDLKGERAFCSEYIIQKLQQVGACGLEDVLAYETDPFDLYTILHSNGSINEIVMNPAMMSGRVELTV